MGESNSPILVTGATGRHGGTGGFVARKLLRQGAAVRALARRDDARSQALVAESIPVVFGDLHDRRSLLPALSGVKTAFFTYPIAAGAVEAAANFAAAGREAGLERIVVMSMAVARPDSPSPLGREQWLAEEVFEWAGFETLNLRIAALFTENIDLLHGHEIHGDGIIENAFGDVPFSWITGEDAARLAVAALLHPERAGQERTIYPSGGPPASHGEVARALSEKLGRPVQHRTISRRDWADRLVALGQTDGRINPAMAAHISAVGFAIRQPLPVNNLYEALTLERPTSILEAIGAGLVGRPPRSEIGG